MVTILADCAYL